MESGGCRFQLFQRFINYLSYKKLFEFPVERDFANEKAFSAAQYPPFFQIFLRIRFFNIELRFFGTAIQKIKSYSLQKLDVKDIYCLKQIPFFFFNSYSIQYRRQNNLYFGVICDTFLSLSLFGMLHLYIKNTYRTSLRTLTYLIKNLNLFLFLFSFLVIGY